MNWKFWQREPQIPIETQTELIDLRAKVAEYATKITELEKRHELTMQMWAKHARILLGLECPSCGADTVAWREQLHEEHHCPDTMIGAKILREIHFGKPGLDSFYACNKEEQGGK